MPSNLYFRSRSSVWLERRSYEPKVAGSSPAVNTQRLQPATTNQTIIRIENCNLYSSLAQLAERVAVNHKVIGSIPIGGVSQFSLVVERCTCNAKVVGSNPTIGWFASLAQWQSVRLLIWWPWVRSPQEVLVLTIPISKIVQEMLY